MSNNFVSLWFHLVWSTKNRKPLIFLNLKKKLYDKMREIADDRGFRLDFINGTENHVHLLISVKPTHSVSIIVKDLKGVTNTWVNQNQLTDEYFEWQEGFGAFSVSPSQIDKVRNYIKNQEIHHRDITYDDEFKRFKRMLSG